MICAACHYEYKGPNKPDGSYDPGFLELGYIPGMVPKESILGLQRVTSALFYACPKCYTVRTGPYPLT